MIRFIISLCMMLLLANENEAVRNKHPRTDGYYIYDNGIDTIAEIPNGREMQLSMIQSMREEGYISKDYRPGHEDSIAKNGDISTDVRILRFFSDSEVQYIGTIHRAEFEKVLAETMLRHKAQTNGGTIDAQVRITDMHMMNDSVVNFTKARNIPVFEEFFTCVVSGDSLRVRTRRTVANMALSKEKVYHFVPLQ